MPKITKRTMLYISDVRELCIKKQWYTRGDVYQYDNMFTMVETLNQNTLQNKGEISTSELYEVAKNIYEHSVFDADYDRNAIIESIMWWLYKTTCTTFEI